MRLPITLAILLTLGACSANPQRDTTDATPAATPAATTAATTAATIDAAVDALLTAAAASTPSRSYPTDTENTRMPCA